MAGQTSTAFFSYSRDDSDFALRLARDLRAAGATVWLDQLDIHPGERWDRSVEDAIAKCTQMLVILSPSSMSSSNVMDEVSFALEEQKTVIPVLYRDCKIPFRLRRVQYSDCRSDYERGLRELVTILRGDERAVTAVEPAAPDSTAGAHDEAATKEQHRREAAEARRQAEQEQQESVAAEARRKGEQEQQKYEPAATQREPQQPDVPFAAALGRPNDSRKKKKYLAIGGAGTLAGVILFWTLMTQPPQRSYVSPPAGNETQEFRNPSSPRGYPDSESKKAGAPAAQQQHVSARETDVQPLAENQTPGPGASRQRGYGGPESKRARVASTGETVGGVLGSTAAAPPVIKKAPPPSRIRVGRNVQSAKLVRQPKPVYPQLAKQARIQGVVKLHALISTDGIVENLTVISGHPLLVPAAMEATKQWVYEPTILNGEAVGVETEIDVNFTLSQ